MNRFNGALVLCSVIVLAVSIPMPVVAQATEECMDCAQRETRHEREDGFPYVQYEALCCDAPCEGYPDVMHEDVGWGCGTRQIENSADFVGTECSSSYDDQGCPESGGGWEEPPLHEDQPTPIILDLGNATYRLTSASDGVPFDIRNEGQRRQVAWTRTGVENALLALDRNGNGQIDNGAELFGNATPLVSGELAPHGFVALRELDENGDGIVDAADAMWTSLLLWTDRNHDGTSTADEIQSIADSAVAGLGIAFQRIGRRDQWGNHFRYMAKFWLRVDGHEHQRTYYDVFLRIAE